MKQITDSKTNNNTVVSLTGNKQKINSNEPGTFVLFHLGFFVSAAGGPCPVDLLTVTATATSTAFRETHTQKQL